RLAKMDLKNWPQARQYVRGDIDADEIYYTNSIHLRPDADVDLVTRIRKQSMFHNLIESGAIIHAFVGENQPSPRNILNLVQKTYEKTNAAQLTISPEFTICKICKRMEWGARNVCPHCGAGNLDDIRRESLAAAVLQGTWSREILATLQARRRGASGRMADALAQHASQPL
ncbi:MAG: anaerobic ribonucleoside-triphosphate reductase, partial [Planctomycetota bacterium]